MTVSIENITHKDEQRIKVVFAYDETAKESIKKIKDARWSQSKRCWHIPYTKTAYAALQQVFDDIIVVKNEGHSVQATKTQEKAETPISETSHTTAHVLRIEPEKEHRMKVFVPYWRKREKDKIKNNIAGSAWIEQQKYWSVPMTQEVVSQLNTWFAGEIIWLFEVEKNIGNNYSSAKDLPTKIFVPFKKVEVGITVPSINFTGQGSTTLSPPINIPKSVRFHSYQKDGQLQTFVTGQEIILSTEPNESWFYAFVPSDKKGWIETVRNIPGRTWCSNETCWRLPYVKTSFRILKKHVGMKYLRILFNINTNVPEDWNVKSIPIKKETSSKLNLNEFQQKAIIAFEEKLMLENKAWRTIKTYKALFTKFMVYFPTIKPSSISKGRIEQYIIYRKQDNISDSQLNQLINTLNCFFVRILNQPEKISKLERPRKKRELPNVFSLEEIEKLLKTTPNLKHKCMLILLYSSGLRKSEVLNLRVNDLSFERKTVFIHKGKGGKDRYTFFADLARKYLKQYLEQYTPSHYLFEGQTGGRYGESSLQSVFEKSRQLSRVRRNVTIHGLRHSFATHLVEKGVPLHVVQDLLGHHSIKTTEIYLHISNKFRKELKSPLDDLNI